MLNIIHYDLSILTHILPLWPSGKIPAVPMGPFTSMGPVRFYVTLLRYIMLHYNAGPFNLLSREQRDKTLLSRCLVIR